MTCTNAQQEKIRSFIENKRIDVDIIPIIYPGGTLVANKWIRDPMGSEITHTIEYNFTFATSKNIRLNYNSAPTCKDNPIVDCSCIQINGTVTDAEIDIALAALSFIPTPTCPTCPTCPESKCNNLLNVGLGTVIGFGLAYLLLKKMK